MNLKDSLILKPSLGTYLRCSYDLPNLKRQDLSLTKGMPTRRSERGAVTLRRSSRLKDQVWVPKASQYEVIVQVHDSMITP